MFCTFDVQKFVYNVQKSMYKNVFSRPFLSSCVALDAGLTYEVLLAHKCLKKRYLSL